MQAIFARLTKVDEETRTVTGRAAQQVVDRDNEVFDYTTSKPNFKSWSAEVYKDTNGASLGNVRAMHGNTCAGKLTDIQFDDVEKAIDVSAKIVDDNEWQKVIEGCYSGFSIGGRYAKKWASPLNGKMVNYYTAVPSEISIVDRPCVPTAKFFTVHKQDGSVEERPFKIDTGKFIIDVDELTKYSPDQERDSHGRFGSGGGSGKDGSKMASLSNKAADASINAEETTGSRTDKSEAHLMAAHAHIAAARHAQSHGFRSAEKFHAAAAQYHLKESTNISTRTHGRK